MATLRTSALRDLFPLTSADDVVRLFNQHLLATGATATANIDEPDLTLLSIVTGLIENTLTSRCAAVPQLSAATADDSATETATSPAAQPEATAIDEHTVGAAVNSSSSTLSTFPTIRLADVTALYDKFESILSLVEPVSSYAGNVTPASNNGTTRRQQQQHQQQQQQSSPAASAPARKFATRELIKRVSDIVWNSLIRSTYKDRAHLQSLYSYLAAGKLDCFGMALAVVAGCQRLGYADVRLAISEDHAWVVFGPSGTDTIEVTWHGKGTEDKRGQPATTGKSVPFDPLFGV